MEEKQTALVECPKCGVTFSDEVGTGCPRCGWAGHAEEAEAKPADGPHLTCPDCRATFMGRPGDTCPKCSAQAGERIGLPWQNRKKKGLGRWRALWRTVFSLHRPRQAFADMQRQRPLREAISFQACISAMLWVLTVVMVALAIAYDPVRPLGERLREFREFFLEFSLIFWTILIQSWILLLLLAVLFQLLVGLLHRKVCDFRDVFTIGAYGTAAPMVWLLLLALVATLDAVGLDVVRAGVYLISVFLPPVLATRMVVTGVRVTWPGAKVRHILTAGTISLLLVVGTPIALAVLFDMANW